MEMYNPQNRLQIAYNQAMQNKSPNWTYTVADMMPSIAEIVAAGTTKNSFNQGRIADSLEREKQRRIAYDQMMRENENKLANDYVQMAKEQLAMDMTADNENYNREQNALNRAYREMIDNRNQANIDREWENKLAQQERENKYRDEKFNIEKQISELTIKKLEAENKALQFANTPEGQKAKAEAEALDKQIKEAQRRKIEAEAAKIERENSPEYLQQQQEQAQKEVEDKANQEQMKKNQERVFTLMNNNSLSPEDGMVVYNNPELYKYLKDDTDWKTGIPVIGSKQKFSLDYEAILKDQNIPVTRNNIKELKKQLGI